MAYSEQLADRVRALVGEDPRLSERKMFGGLCLMISGNMFLGIVGDELMVRVGADGYEDALKRPHTREMDFTGRAMKGMVFVAPKGIAKKPDLERWVDSALEFADSLPPKR